MQPSLSKPGYAGQLEKILLVLCLGLIAGSSLLIPSLGTSRYASPDETAVAQTVTTMVTTGKAAIPEPLAEQYPWVHPRSWVSQGNTIVPVGFLGWPMVLAPLRLLLGESYMIWAGWFLLVSAIYPFFRLLRQAFSQRATWIGTLVMLASPAMIVYANRSLFPNVGLIATALWSLWLIRESGKKPAWGWLAGIVCGITLIIRPIEAIWLLPWWMMMWVGQGTAQSHKKPWKPFLLGGFAMIGLLLIANAYTYGDAWKVGYWLKDNLIKTANSVLLENSEKPLSLSSIFPFGIHPHSILWNLRAFGSAFLWPSALILLSGVYVYVKQKKTKEEEPLWRGVLPPAFWMTGVLLVMYGSGLYRDHVQVGAVTVGNSFLRYLLPLAPLTGLAAAHLAERYVTRRLAIGALLIGYVAFGVYAALIKDDEGIWKTRQELRRYATVQEAAKTYFSPKSVIISERSDKIFAPHFRGVSPLPPLEQVAALVRDEEAGVQVGLYARPLSQAERDAWRRQGVELIDRGSFARERLYQLMPR